MALTFVVRGSVTGQEPATGVCIYCEGDSSTAAGVAHVLPEAVAKNDLVLPRGAVCDKCNNYLGKLDGTLVTHPMVAAGIQALKLPGKDGRVRKVLGNVSREEPTAITIPTGAPTYKYGPHGRTVSVAPLVSRDFDELRFRRALHHIALNTVALRDGVASVLQPRFDLVRQYVRAPQRDEAWPFAQLMLLPNLSSDLAIELFRGDSYLIVGMRIVAAVFYVDLFTSGRLKRLVEREQTVAPELKYLSSTDRLSRSDPQEGGAQYRIQIFDE